MLPTRLARRARAPALSPRLLTSPPLLPVLRLTPVRALASHGPTHGDELGSDYAIPPGLTPLQGYEHLVSARKVTRDAHQLRTIKVLEALYTRLAAVKPPREVPPQAPPAAAAAAARPSGGFFSSLFGAGASKAAAAVASTAAAALSPPPVKGLYLYGSPGCGKTFLMDLFYRCAPTGKKKRVHFHSFMLDVHARLHSIRTVDGHRGDPIPVLAGEMAAGTWVMCFDEMQVTDVGDAMIMRRLFEALFARGVVVVATSNRAPRDLYKNGLQRELFLPFIADVERHCEVYCMDSSTDYRLQGTPLKEGATWLAGSGAATRPLFEAAWLRAVVGKPTSSVTLTAQGRSVEVPLAAPAAHVARFTFDELCGRPLYTADYLVLAQTFHTLFIEGIPSLTLSERNELRRFIVLIDTLYEHRVKLVASAAAPAPALFTPIFRGDGEGSKAPASSTSAADAKYDEVFAFERTVSRLMEMQSQSYLESEWRPHVTGTKA